MSDTPKTVNQRAMETFEEIERQKGSNRKWSQLDDGARGYYRYIIRVTDSIAAKEAQESK
jgi:hypothetical protein